MNPQSPLPTRRLDAGASIVQAQPWTLSPATLETPALDVMTDLTRVKAATTGASTLLRQAEQMMIFQGVRMLFVVNEMPTLLGLVTHTDLRGDRAVRIAQNHGVHYDELTVGDVMVALPSLDAIDVAAMRRATVSNVVATLKAHGRHHLLVVEGSPSRVCGIVSRTQVERQLGMPIDVVEVACSFAELGQMLS